MRATIVMTENEQKGKKATHEWKNAVANKVMKSFYFINNQRNVS